MSGVLDKKNQQQNILPCQQKIFRARYGADDNKSLRLGGNQQFPMENALRVHKSVENVHFR